MVLKFQRLLSSIIYIVSSPLCRWR